MSNNAPDYENNLAFVPDMTWDELVKWVMPILNKLNEACFRTDRQPSYFQLCNIVFFESGLITTDERAYITDGISYSKMKAIIENMFCD